MSHYGASLRVANIIEYKLNEFHPEVCSKCFKSKFKYILPKCLICKEIFCYKHCFRCSVCQQYYCYKCVPKNRTKKINQKIYCVYCDNDRDRRCVLF